MSERTQRGIPVAYLSLALASLSLGAAFYQGWINSRNLANVTRDIARREHIRACKEIIDAYFEVKARAGLVLSTDLRITEAAPSQAAPPKDAVAAGPSAHDALGAAVAVGHFAAIGTYLANFQDAATRVRYTELSRALAAAVAAAPSAPPGKLGEVFQRADQLFAELNADCVATAAAAPL